MVDNISLDGIPDYKSFFEEQETYEQIHVHLQDMRYKAKTDSCDIGKSIKGAGAFLFGKRSYSVIIETVGEESGSTPFFPIGTDTSPPVENEEPTWDKKLMVVGRKGKIESLKLSVYEGKNMKFSCTFPRSELGLDDADWLQFTAEDSTSNMELNFRVRIASKPIVSKSDFESIYNDTNLAYEEIELTDDATGLQSDSALLQAFRHKSGSKKAILWILGRNDGFMHSHVFYRLLNESKFDLYVLNYRYSSRCLSKGWVEDPHLNSHCHAGTHDVYVNEITKALKTIHTTKKYDKTIGYAHSTGAPIFFNYLIEIGDDGFDGFIFNSPFLDFAGGMNEFMADVVSTLAKYKVLSIDFHPAPAIPPEVKGKCKYKVNQQELVLNAWASKIFSEYYFDTGTRPVYIVPLTAGYMRGAEVVQEKIRARLAKKDPITLKPFVVLTSRSDDVLDSESMGVLVDAIGTARTEIELRDNAHDNFLSHDKRDTDLAIDLIKVWMKRYNFY